MRRRVLRALRCRERFPRSRLQSRTGASPAFQQPRRVAGIEPVHVGKGFRGGGRRFEGAQHDSYADGSTDLLLSLAFIPVGAGVSETHEEERRQHELGEADRVQHGVILASRERAT